MITERAKFLAKSVVALAIVFALLPALGIAGAKPALNANLMEAAKQGDSADVTSLLAEGADVNAKDAHGRTALMEAVRAFRIEPSSRWAIERSLLETIGPFPAGFAPFDRPDLYDFTSIGWMTPVELDDFGKLLSSKDAFTNAGGILEDWTLIDSAGSGYLDVINLLLEKGADINAKDHDGRTALMFAVLKGHEPLFAQLVCCSGAEVNARDLDGRTALMEAAWAGHQGIATWLIEWEADVNAKDKYGKTALHSAVEAGHIDPAKLLLEKGADVNAMQDDGWTAMRTAVMREDVRIVELLRAHGANDMTLGIAAMLGDAKQINRILERGDDVNATRERGRTALLWAALVGKTEAVMLLLAKGADVNSSEPAGTTALMHAVDNSHVELVRLLLKNGAHVNAVTSEGMTALMISMRQPHLGIVNLLLENGADVNIKNFENRTAAQMISWRGYDKIEKALKAHGAKKEHLEHGHAYVPREGLNVVRDDVPSGGSPAPKSPHQSIRLESQEVTIRLKENEYEVDAVFHFFNTGDTTNEWIGFPLGNDSDSKIRWFAVWVGGGRVALPDEPFCGRNGSIDSVESVPSVRWFAQRLTFPGRKRTTVRVSYRSGYALIGTSAQYAYGTGSFWKDPIERSVFIIDGSALGGTRRIHARLKPQTPACKQITKNAVRYEIRNFEPEPASEIAVRVKPPGWYAEFASLAPRDLERLSVERSQEAETASWKQPVHVAQVGSVSLGSGLSLF